MGGGEGTGREEGDHQPAKDRKGCCRGEALPSPLTPGASHTVPQGLTASPRTASPANTMVTVLGWLPRGPGARPAGGV